MGTTGFKCVSRRWDMDIVEQSLLFAMDTNLICLVIDNLTDARDAWYLMSTSKEMRSIFTSLPASARPLLRLGATLSMIRCQDRYNQGFYCISYQQVMSVVQTGTCRVEAAAIGDFRSTAGRMIPPANLACMLHCAGPCLTRLVLVNITVELFKKFSPALPIKELYLIGCSVGSHGDNRNVLAGLRLLTSLEHLTLETTDVCSVQGLAAHPSLTSLDIGGEKWGERDDIEDGYSDGDDDDEAGSGMPSLSGIYKIPKLAHLDLSNGLEQGSRTGGFRLSDKDFSRLGKCVALQTLHIPVCGGDDILLHRLAKCPRLEKIWIYMGRGWDEEDGDFVSHDFLCRCPSLTHVLSNHGWIEGDPREYFQQLAAKLARSHPGLMVALPCDTNDYPGDEDFVAVEEFLGDGDEEDDELEQ